MIHQSPPQRRPMAVKVAATSPPRPVLQLRWTWLILAVLMVVGAALLVAVVVW